jgi:hypothetical protein
MSSGVSRSRPPTSSCRTLGNDRSIDTGSSTSFESVAAGTHSRRTCCRRPRIQRGARFPRTCECDLRRDGLIGRMPARSVGNAAQLSHHCHWAAPRCRVFQAEAGRKLRESAHQLRVGGDGPRLDLGASAAKRPGQSHDSAAQVQDSWVLGYGESRGRFRQGGRSVHGHHR